MSTIQPPIQMHNLNDSSRLIRTLYTHPNKVDCNGQTIVLSLARALKNHANFYGDYLEIKFSDPKGTFLRTALETFSITSEFNFIVARAIEAGTNFTLKDNRNHSVYQLLGPDDTSTVKNLKSQFMYSILREMPVVQAIRAEYYTQKAAENLPTLLLNRHAEYINKYPFPIFSRRRSSF